MDDQRDSDGDALQVTIPSLMASSSDREWGTDIACSSSWRVGSSSERSSLLGVGPATERFEVSNDSSRSMGKNDSESKKTA